MKFSIQDFFIICAVRRFNISNIMTGDVIYHLAIIFFLELIQSNWWEQRKEEIKKAIKNRAFINLFILQKAVNYPYRPEILIKLIYIAQERFLLATFTAFFKM